MGIVACSDDNVAHIPAACGADQVDRANYTTGLADGRGKAAESARYLVCSIRSVML
jgi:hypothetical protein